MTHAITKSIAVAIPVIALCLIGVGALLYFAACVPLQQQKGLEGTSDRQIAQRIDRLISALHGRTGFGGIVGVSKRGRRIYTRAYGIAQEAAAGARPAETRFPIASLSKQFTSYAVLSLQQEGLLKVTDPVALHIGETAGKWIGGVSINELLNHVSGLPAYFPVSTLLRAQRCRECLWSADDVIDAVLDLNRPEERGKFLYSDMGYALLRAVIERITGQPWPAYLEERIFKPFGLRNTGVHRPAHALDMPRGNLCVLRPLTGRRLVCIGMPTWNYSMVYGASGVYSTVADLIRWGELINRETNRSGLYRQLIQAESGRYVAGWVVAQSREGKIRYYFHDGRVPGYSATFYRVPDRQIVIAVLSNSDPTNSAYAYGRELLHLVLGEGYWEIDNE